MARLPITYVDVFAARPHEGNHLPVVHAADLLSESTMAAYARRTRQSETSFLQAPTVSQADYRNRIFTVESEIPFAGHPTLGAAAALCHHAGTPTRELWQQSMHGVHRVLVSLDGDSGSVSMEQSACEFGELVDAGDIARSLGIPAEALHPTLPAQVLSTGLPMIVVPLGSLAPLRSARLDRKALGHALESIEAESAMSLNCYVVAEESEGEWSARSFSLDVVGGEDPATGSAAGPFGAYLRDRLGLIRLGISQGVDMGEPSRLQVDTSDGIVVSGDVHVVATGMIDLPEG